MEHFAYSFLVSIIHSIWQAALLALVAKIIFRGNPNLAPLVKRNVLLRLLSAQLFLTAASFYFVFQQPIAPGIFDVSALNEGLFQSPFHAYAGIIFYAYVVVVLMKSLTMMVSWRRFTTDLKKHAQKAPLDLRFFTNERALAFGITRKVQLWCTHHVGSPVTYGFWKPVILLPVALVNQLSLEEAETLITHELTHIRNKDYLWNWMVLAMETLYFFNPFVLLLAKQVKQEREKSCDLQVIDFKYSPLTYAEALLKAARAGKTKAGLQLNAVKSQGDLLRRIHYFSVNADKNFLRKNSLLSTLMVPLFLLMSVVFVSQVINQQKPQSRSQENVSLHLGFSPEYQKIIENNLAVLDVKHPDVETTENTPGENFISANETEPSQIEKADIPSMNYADAEEITTLPSAMTIANEIPVPKVLKEVLIQEVNNDGEKVTIALQAQLENGEWVMKPLWIVSQQKTDSIFVKGKDSVLVKIPAVQ